MKDLFFKKDLSKTDLSKTDRLTIDPISKMKDLFNHPYKLLYKLHYKVLLSKFIIKKDLKDLLTIHLNTKDLVLIPNMSNPNKFLENIYKIKLEKEFIL